MVGLNLKNLLPVQIGGFLLIFPLYIDADLAELENRELLDKVKRWEDSELSTQNIENKDLIVQKKLAPLNEGGPMQLLKAQVRLIFIPNSMENQVFPLKLVF